MHASSEQMLIVLVGICVILLLLIAFVHVCHKVRMQAPSNNANEAPSFSHLTAPPSMRHQKLNEHAVPAHSGVVYDAIRPDPNYKVSYVTDVEGNWEYFLAFVEQSAGLRLVSLDEGGSVARIDLLDQWRFIFGGDVCDKGRAVGGSLRVSRSLLLLQSRYPDRVTLILGNRDVNKLRLTSEVHACPGTATGWAGAVLGRMGGSRAGCGGTLFPVACKALFTNAHLFTPC